MLATLPMTDPVGAVEELKRAVRAGAVGAMVYGRTGDVPLDDPRFDDLLAMATSLRVPLFIHPQIPSQPLRLAAYSGFEPIVDLALATFSWGWHIEAATAALRLIARGAFDRHPDLQIVLGHWGELLMFWHERIAGLSRLAHLDRPVHEVLRHNVHLTASGMLDPALLRHSLAVTTIDRILFSTDFPFQRPRLDDIAALLSEFDSDEDRERFMSGNAMKLFRIDGVASGSEGDRS
jgi:predicted TIM-barrel fold metal-dependent hydrolase